jgi:hypothetical protein
VTLGAVAALFVAGCSAHPDVPQVYEGKCSPQTADPSADGRAAEDTALTFVKDVEAQNTSGAWSEMTTAAQAATSGPQLSSLAQTIKSRGPTGSPTIVAAYVLQFLVPPKAFAFIPCPAQGPHKGMDFIGAGPAAKQAYVVLSTATAQDSQSIYSIALRFEDGAWRLERFHFDPSTMAGRDAFAWWALAKRQAQEGHALNAALLYATAHSLLSRGPDYQPVGLADLSQEMAKLPTPPEIQGQPPYSWSLEGQPFKITSIGTYGVEQDKALLALVQRAPFTTDAQADQLNHRLIDAYAKAHPEWTEVFDVVASRTCQPDGNRCFGTLFEKGAGLR